MLVPHTSRDCTESFVKYSRAVQHPRVLDVQAVPEAGKQLAPASAWQEMLSIFVVLVRSTLGLDSKRESPGEDSSQPWEKRLG